MDSDDVLMDFFRVSDAKVLDPEALGQIITDPLLSSSRVPEGMFYKGVVVAETDADTAFYQRLSQKVGHLMKSIFCMGRESKLKKVIASYPKRQESCAKRNTYGG